MPEADRPSETPMPAFVPPERPTGKDRNGGLSPKTDLVIRAFLIMVLLLIVVAALRWRVLAARVQRAEALYRDFQYESALAAVAPALREPLAALKLRPRARRVDILSRAHIAAEAQTAEGYIKAIRLLESARRLGVSKAETDPAIKEYEAALQRLRPEARKE